MIAAAKQLALRPFGVAVGDERAYRRRAESHQAADTGRNRTGYGTRLQFSVNMSKL